MLKFSDTNQVIDVIYMGLHGIYVPELKVL